jgi:uncharacterized membrane protein YagU involved in acid resistance
MMLEVDLDASPRTLRFFRNNVEQPGFITHIPQSINFAVCYCLSPAELHPEAGLVVS